MAIQGFRRAELEALLRSGRAPKWLPASIRRAAYRKLVMLDAALTLQDLRVPPGNRLEALSGNWKGFHSIRVNQQWRVVFRWTPQGPENVDIVDYH